MILQYWPLAIVALIAHLVRNYLKLSKYHAPHPLAHITNWWRFFDVLGRNAHETHIRAHRKHEIVRLGPNTLSFGNPSAIKTIYLNKALTKSDFYPVQTAIAKGKPLPSLFSTKDEVYHAQYRRCVNSAFSMTNLRDYEPLVDSTLDIFIEKTRDLDKTVNFARWLQFFAFDVIGELTWSRRLGFIEGGDDSIIEFVSRFLDYAAPVGQAPWLDKVMQKNPIRLKLQEYGFGKVFAVTKFARARWEERSEKSEKGDLLSKFLQAQKDHPETMTDKQVLASSASMIFAGSETTAISLAAIFYYLLKNPEAYSKLMVELDAMTGDGHNKKVTWAEAQQLPYLDAVIQEAFRLHPAPGLILERVVPPQGMEICGEHIVGGTIVGCNPWVVQRSSLFGDDPDTFRPERWLEATDEQLREMKGAMLQFGAGARTCIGKNISLLEIYKLVPTFLRNFKVELARPDLEWKTHNAWFVRQLGFEAKFSPRAMPSK